jgi:DNA-binding transcriptional ArsR family regulator
MSDPLELRFTKASRILKALSHELRLEMVCGLRHEPCTQTFIAQKLGLPQSTVAQHLKVLRSEGLVSAERRGVEVVFSLADPRIEQILDALCHKEQERARYSWDEIANFEQARRSGDYT